MAINKRKVLEAARKYAQKGAQAKALKEFDKLLKLDPRDARLRLEVGDAHRRWGNADRAIETYRQVAEQYTKEGFDARAVAVYKQIHNLKPDAYDTYAPLADLYQRMGLDAEAIVALQTAADGYHKQGLKTEALDLLRKMAMLDPTNTSSRIKVADLLRHEGMNDEAVAEYEEVASELERQGDIESATSVYERILEVQPERRETLVKLAEKLVERGLVERAEPFVKQLLEAEPDEPARYELMATVYRLQQRDQELADTYRKLAELHRRRGDDDHAREILQRYVPSAAFEPQEVGIDAETAFGALDSVVSLSDASPAEDAPSDEPSPLPLSESHALDTTVFDPDGSSHLDDGTFDTFDSDDGDFLAGSDDDESIELELDDPLDSPAPIREAAAPAAGGAEPAGDPEQLLAEASVYLRYGKREQAIENLKAIIAQDPAHRRALEKLGEAYIELGDEPQAISLWLDAAEASRAQGDFDAVAELRDRIAAIDPGAANSLGPAPAHESPPTPSDTGSGPPQVEPTVVNLDAVPADAAEDPNEVSREIDLDDIEIDIDSSEFAEEIPTPGADDDEEPEPPGAVEPIAAEADDAPADASSDAAVSAATVQQISEDLEEADFYMKQGLADEAEAIYRRVLEIAPNHPHALVRLGEVAALRGDDPASSQPDLDDPASLNESTAGDAAPVADAESSFRDDIPGPDDSIDELMAADPAADSDAALGSDTSLDDEAVLDDDSDVEVVFDPEDGEGLDLADASSDASLAGDADAAEGGAAAADSFAEVTEPVGIDLSDASADEALSAVESPDEDTAEEVEPDAAGDAIAAAEAAVDDETTDEDLAPEPEISAAPALEVTEDAAADAVAEAESPPVAEEAPEPVEAMAADEADAAPDVVSPDDSYSESGVALGEGPELALPEDADDSTDTDMASENFDLAAELSDVFDDPDGASSSGLGDSGDGFEAVFREFKRGVSQTLSENDHEAHFDLGIAYREMGLYEDAKNEFRAAMLHPQREIECRHMLGLCSIEMEQPAEAVAEFERIAGADEASDEQRLSARFELGRAFVALGERARARAVWQAVAAQDASFCDVTNRIAELDAPEPDPDASGDLESFDDLIADAEDASGGEPAEQGYESFDDVVGEAEQPAEAELEDDVADAGEPLPEAEPLPEPEPEPAPKKRRSRKKISFV